MQTIGQFSIFLLYLLYVNADMVCVLPGPPDLIRVSMGGPNEVIVSWRTRGSLNVSTYPPHIDNDILHPRVEYSTSSTFSEKVLSSQATSTTYGYGFGKSWFHNCHLYVRPSTRYYYRIPAAPNCVSKSKTYTFVTPPSFGSSDPINITIVGDLGNDDKLNHYSATKTIHALTEAADTTNFFLHVGDISYADDPEFHSQSYEERWNTFQQNMEPITSQNFYMTLPGNHEVTCNQLGDNRCNRGSALFYRNFAAYLNRFRMPGKESGGYGNMWYSYNFGPVHMVIIDTETDFPSAPSGPGTLLNGTNFEGETGQLQWLRKDLQKAKRNRHNVPWIIVAGHRPFFGSAPYYNISMNHSDNCEPCAKAFAEILYDFDVDFYFCGHVHWFERLYPVNASGAVVARNYNNQKGVIHVTTGAGGAAEGANTLNATGNATASANIIPGTYGFARLEIKDRSHCRLTFYDSIQRNVTDSVDIIRVH